MKILKSYCLLISVITFCEALKTCPKSMRAIFDKNDGNKAIFKDIKSQVNQSTMSTSYDAQGLQPFFNLAKSFMNTVQPNSIGKKLAGGKTNYGTKAANEGVLRSS